MQNVSHYLLLELKFQQIFLPIIDCSCGDRLLGYRNTFPLFIPLFNIRYSRLTMT